MRSRRLVVPEIVQTSGTDCGPACLKALLEGFEIPVSYGRLREACQTNIDGTSIDSLESVAVELGLDAQQVLLPADHLLLPDPPALPAIVVVTLPSGFTHFIVAWSLHGPFIQLMDPATGRRWSTARGFLGEVYIHRMPVSARAWREWAGSEEFCRGLRRRMSGLGLRTDQIAALIETALVEPGWRSMACLDAAVRLVSAIVSSGGIPRGESSGRVLERFFEESRAGGTVESEFIPDEYWTVRPMGTAAPATPAEEQLIFRGAVLVRASRKVPAGQTTPQPALATPELAAALEEEPSSRPGRQLLRLLRADGLLRPAVLAAGTATAAAAVVLQALLFRALMDAGRELGNSGQRLGALGLLFVFLLFMTFLEFPIITTVLRAGRRLEGRLRIALLVKIPRLSDRYFHSRLVSDMAERGHNVHQIRTLPALTEQLARLALELVFTTVGIIWLDPARAPLALLAATFAVGLPLALQPVLAERELRLRTHAGALSRFYLDALLGLVPIRAHTAERAIQREHESLLAAWARSGFRLQHIVVASEGVQLLVGFALAASMVVSYIVGHGGSGSVILLAYWALNVPVLGRELVLAASQYPAVRNEVLRLLEPLGAPEEHAGFTNVSERPATVSHPPPDPGMSFTMEGVSVRAAGHTILAGIDLHVDPGSHVAIVGLSGAGKSSLVGVLLGWHRPAGGRVLADGMLLDGERLRWLRRQTAWVEPGIQIWNRSLMENLRYGAPGESSHPIGQIIDFAELRELLEKLPEGLQSGLGEGGGLLSAGEGQRVRLARAMLRPEVRLVILDEPFIGLDGPCRERLLNRTRALWRDRTMLYATHEIGQANLFPRVLVVHAGKVVEDGSPGELLAKPHSRYRALLRAEQALREDLWEGDQWWRMVLEEGRVSERNPRREGKPEAHEMPRGESRPRKAA